MRQTPERYQIIRKLKMHLEKVGIDIGARDFSQNDFADPYFDIEESGYSYHIKERDKFLKSIRNLSEDELLYLLVKDFIESEAVDYELKNRIDGQDFRRLYFDYAKYLMKKIDYKWEKILEEEFVNVLKKNPFQDI